MGGYNNKDFASPHPTPLRGATLPARGRDSRPREAFTRNSYQKADRRISRAGVLAVARSLIPRLTDAFGAEAVIMERRLT